MIIPIDQDNKNHVVVAWLTLNTSVHALNERYIKHNEINVFSNGKLSGYGWEGKQ